MFCSVSSRVALFCFVSFCFVLFRFVSLCFVPFVAEVCCCCLLCLCFHIILLRSAEVELWRRLQFDYRRLRGVQVRRTFVALSCLFVCCQLLPFFVVSFLLSLGLCCGCLPLICCQIFVVVVVVGFGLLFAFLLLSTSAFAFVVVVGFVCCWFVFYCSLLFN